MRAKAVPVVFLLSTLLAAFGELPPELLLRDSFNASQPSDDINLELATRQTGKLAPLRLIEDGNTSAGSEKNRTMLVPDASGQRLMLMPRNGNYGSRSLMWAAPDHDFLESPRWIIEFDVEPHMNDVADLSTNWVGVHFGTPTPGRRASNPDGIGILFRSNRELVILAGSTTPLLTKPGLPAGAFHARIVAETLDFDGASPVNVKLYTGPVDNSAAPALFAEVTTPNGIRNNRIGMQGACDNFVVTDIDEPAQPGKAQLSDENWIDFFDNFQVSVIRCIQVAPFVISAKANEPSREIIVTVPPALTAGGPAQVIVKSLSPQVAVPVGATAGELVLNFPQGGTEQRFQAVGFRRGTAVFQLSNPAGVCVNRSVEVNVSGLLLENTSFEAPTGDGADAIPGWQTSGSSGLDNAGGFYADNGLTADGRQVAFLSGPSRISQGLFGLDTNSTYWVQVFYNASTNGSRPALAVKFNDVVLDTVSEVNAAGDAAGYFFRNIRFQPSRASGLLEIGNDAAEPDSILLLDSVSVVKRSVEQWTVQNPGFEASGTILTPASFAAMPLAGWTIEGEVGLDRAGGTFANNGAVPEQEHVLYFNGPSSIEQRLEDLVLGATYELSVYANAGTGTAPKLKIELSGQLLLEQSIAPVGGSAPYLEKKIEFTASGSTALLRLSQSSELAAILLLDDLRITQKGGGASVSLKIAKSGDHARISWPSTATGFLLESAPAVGASWNPVSGSPTINSGEFELLAPDATGTQFYRLRRNASP